MTDFSLQRPALKAVSEELFDLIVIGGGITGAGIALDAQSRGLKTLLLEKDDFASGTSSKSTKLVHGGLRYLQNLQFAVTLESVRERQLLKQLAPHLVRQIPFIVPLYAGKRLHNFKIGVGLSVYDRMAGKRGTGKHKRISREEVLEACPGIREDGLIGGFRYYDCQTDDARLVLDVVKSAARFGATALNYVKVTGLVQESGTVCGVEAVDTLAGGAARVVKALSVINATGAWTQTVSDMSGRPSTTEVVPSKGVHIIVSAKRLPITSAMLVDSPSDGRFCFAVPWNGSILIGTTDAEYQGNIDRIAIERDEVDYILEAVNHTFPLLNLTGSDLSGIIAGVRPLVRQLDGKKGGSTADISREHRLDESEDGLISISGGKLTTYRPMAQEVVDLVVRQLLSRGFSKPLSACRTTEIMLGDWSDRSDFEATRAAVKERAAANGLPNRIADQLLRDYGKAAQGVLDLVEHDGQLSARIACEQPYILAQVVYAVRNESAVNLEDVLARRMRLSVLDRNEAILSAGFISWIMARELGWTEAQRIEQVRVFRSRLEKVNEK